ncbi:hypothetical protein [Prosthecobacter sp.]|uniref:hypothetical protein n=1 Tax=Prosthecobacter sp. TaxID=1965333 RepID=UPI0037837FB5
MKAIILIVTLFTVSLQAQLIDSPKPQPSTVQLAAQSIVDAVNNEIAHRVAVHRICFETLWRNPRPGVTPAAILSELGTKATLVFAFASENLDHIDRCARMVGKTRADFISDADCTPPLAFTAHADGTVTINP